MDESVIKSGFWSIDEFNQLNYQSTTFIEDYRYSEKLRLYITQLESDKIVKEKGLSKLQLNKLVLDWCKKLPTLNEVRYLWLPSRVNQKLFDSICEMQNLEGLWIKWSGVQSIERLNNLKNLKHLFIGSSSKIENIEVFKEMKNLRTLEMEHFKKISNFSVLANLTQLEGLGIDGSLCGTQSLDNIHFISSLKELKYLTLTNTKIKDKSFNPILSLERFNCSWNYPESEFQKLKAIKSLKYGNIETSWEEINNFSQN